MTAHSAAPAREPVQAPPLATSDIVAAAFRGTLMPMLIADARASDNPVRRKATLAQVVAALTDHGEGGWLRFDAQRAGGGWSSRSGGALRAGIAVAGGLAADESNPPL